MLKTVYGQCPIQDKEVSISVKYIDASTLSERCYEKGTFRCDYNIYGNKCSASNCPLYASAPNELH